MLYTILGSILGAGVLFTIMFLLGRLQQQRAQVIEMRGTNVKLLNDLRDTQNAYNYLQQQVEKIQSGPVSAVIGYEQINKIAELVAARIDFTTIGSKTITKKDVN